MMIGPAPMIRIVEMSVRLGIVSQALRGAAPARVRARREGSRMIG
jgi:hypothetical protein